MRVWAFGQYLSFHIVKGSARKQSACSKISRMAEKSTVIETVYNYCMHYFLILALLNLEQRQVICVEDRTRCL